MHTLLLLLFTSLFSPNTKLADKYVHIGNQKFIPAKTDSIPYSKSDSQYADSVNKTLRNKITNSFLNRPSKGKLGQSLIYKK